MRLVLFQPDIPQNTGAAIRVAACLGAGIDIIEPCGFPLSDKALRRAAMDYGDLCRPDIHSSWTAFRSARPGARPVARLVLLTTAAERSIWDFSFREGDMIVLGRESAGVPEEVHAAADARLAVPMAAGARSLNVVTAGAIALAEARRQIGWPPAGDKTA